MDGLKLRAADTITESGFALCHGGEGTLLCRSLLDGFDSTMLAFMHHDLMPAGVSIGVHTHERNEEIYYLVSGGGVLTFDGEELPFGPGDISLVTPGHSHGFRADVDSVLIVVGTKDVK